MSVRFLSQVLLALAVLPLLVSASALAKRNGTLPFGLQTLVNVQGLGFGYQDFSVRTLWHRL